MSEPVGRGRRSRLVWVNLALAVVVALLVAASATLLVRGSDTPGADVLPERKASGTQKTLVAYDDVVRAVKEWTAAFLEVDFRDMDPIIDRVLAVSADPFKDQYEKNREQLRALVIANLSTSSGKVREVGVSELKGDRAVVFVAADSTVKNKSTKKPEGRYYRMKLTVLSEGGSWRVSNVEFVP